MAKLEGDEYPSATAFFPRLRTLPAFHTAAEGCRGCPLYQRATQTVFGEGPIDARIMLVGEKPGDLEDRAGRPFVGPAGRLLDRALEAAGLLRDEVYVTNVVKHFKWEAKGKKRLHQKPNAKEIAACRPWLDAELAFVKPDVVVCLGATAAQALLGRSFRVSTQSGLFVPSPLAPHVMATLHPSAILRSPDDDTRREQLVLLTRHLAKCASVLRRRSVGHDLHAPLH